MTKIHFLIKSADHVITSSPYLSDYYCRHLNQYNASSFITSSLNITIKFRILTKKLRLVGQEHSVLKFI